MARELKRRSKSNIDNIVNSAIKSIRKIKKRPIKNRVEFISSGSITLNLALSGKGQDGGWARGRIVNIVGDGSSGKTLLALEACFWAWKNLKKIKSELWPNVKKLTIVYNNTEGVMDFPIELMYGKEFVKDVTWIQSPNVEHLGRDYYRRCKELKKKGNALIYIIDSWDSIRSSKDIERFEASVKNEVDEKGSFNLEKQAFASKFFSTATQTLKDNIYDSTMFIISQVRTNIGMSFGPKTYRAGGKALDFYTHQVAWIREIEKLKKTKRGQLTVYAIKSAVKVKRSKVSKPFREAEFTILFDFGLDNLSSQIDYLWGKKQIKFNSKKFSTKESFIKYIEKNNLETALAEKTENKWCEIEQAFTDEVKKRKSRY